MALAISIQEAAIHSVFSSLGLPNRAYSDRSATMGSTVVARRAGM